MVNRSMLILFLSMFLCILNLIQLFLLLEIVKLIIKDGKLLYRFQMVNLDKFHLLMGFVQREGELMLII
jgi:hypothetical protein